MVVIIAILIVIVILVLLLCFMKRNVSSKKKHRIDVSIKNTPKNDLKISEYEKFKKSKNIEMNAYAS